MMTQNKVWYIYMHTLAVEQIEMQTDDHCAAASPKLSWPFCDPSHFASMMVYCPPPMDSPS